MLNPDIYSGAVIRLATLQKERGKPGRLLFASVSLLVRGRQLPSPMVGKGLDLCRVGKTGETVFFRRVSLSTQEAVDWYRSLGNGNEATPVPSRSEERNSDYDGIGLEVPPLIDDPTWPYLGLPIGEGSFAHPSGRSHPAPFIGAGAARIHRRFGSQDGFDLMLSDDKAVGFIARRLHIDLRLYKEYLGSVALVVPDPVLKQIDHFMIPASDDRGERIFYRFVPRAGESLANLKLVTFDEQANLLTDISSLSIPADGILDIDKGDCTGAYGYAVSHPDHGALAYSPPYPFLRQVDFNINAVSQGGATISVRTGESANSDRMEYQAAQRSSQPSSRLIGDGPRLPNVNARVAVAALHREKLVKAKHYGQRWFPNNSREQAMRFIQRELKRAKSRVMIADPYLAGLQLWQFLYAVDPETTSVTLITSSLAFKSKDQERPETDDFSAGLAEFRNKAKVSVEVFVLRPSILHDRFLIVDDSAWFLGNSLNTLGVKSSLIVKLPNPDEIIDRLEDMLNGAIMFEEFKVRERNNENQGDATS